MIAFVSMEPVLVLSISRIMPVSVAILAEVEVAMETLREILSASNLESTSTLQHSVQNLRNLLHQRQNNQNQYQELAVKITENLEKKKPEVPECSEARTIQKIPIAVAETLLLETQHADTNVVSMDSSDFSINFENEQDEVEIKRFGEALIIMEAEAVSLGKQAQFLQLLSFLEDEEEQPKRKCKLEERVDISDMAESSLFMQRTRSAHLAHALPFHSASASSSSSDRTLIKQAKSFLSDKPYKLGRVYTLSGSSSGTGWISTPPCVLTCAHVVHAAKSEQLYFQFSADNTIAKLKVLYVRPEADYQGDYKRDVAFLELKSIMNSSTPISTLEIAGIDAGQLSWTCKRVTAGMLAPYTTLSPLESQKMLNSGFVESHSWSLATTNARADKGFSGGPILNQEMQII
ncbi:hypothetical protein L7F22_066558 [Adiantum nelumboides]|nr:hypothetical protein [Adiantum nelumboides]